MSHSPAAVRSGGWIGADAFFGAATGLAVALYFGGSILSGLVALWSGVALPAFHELATSGLPWCG